MIRHRVAPALSTLVLLTLLCLPVRAEAGQQVSFAAPQAQAGAVISTTQVGGTKYYLVVGVGWVTESSLTAAIFQATWVDVLGNTTPIRDRAHTFGELQAASSASGSMRWFPALAVSGGFEASDSTLLFGAGPRIIGEPAGAKFQFFGQFLVGGLHFSGGTGFSGGTDFVLTPGGGVLIPLQHQRIRISAQLDFPIDFFGGGHETAKQFTFGVAIPLGKH